MESNEVNLMGVSSFDTDPSDFIENAGLEVCEEAMTTTTVAGKAKQNILLDHCASSNHVLAKHT